MGDERYELNSVEEGFEIIKDESLRELFDIFIKDFEKKVNFQGIYNSKKEIKEDIKERIFDGLEEEYNDLRYRISGLRKKGEDVDFIDFRVLRFPLKLELFKAEFDKDNYGVVKGILEEANKELSKFKEE